MSARRKSETPTPDWRKKVSVRTKAVGGRKQGKYTMLIERMTEDGRLEIMVDTDRTITLDIKQLVRAAQKLSLTSEMVEWELIE